jgi:hypothetical protein
MMTRRQAIKTTALASAALAALPGAIAQTNFTAPAAATGRAVHPAAAALRLRRAGTLH